MMINLSVAGLTALAWTVTGVAAALTAGRYVIRMKRLNGLQFDDGLHALALMTLVVYTAVYTASLPMVYALQAWLEGQGPELSVSTLKRYHLFGVVLSILFWVCMYSVKFAFLVFYRHLFGVSRSFMKGWWAVFIWTVLTFGVCIVVPFFICRDIPFITCLSDSSLSRPKSMLEVQCVLNIVSDLAIMGLPICMLKRLQHITRAQKIGLASLFSMATIVIIVDVLRSVYALGMPVVALDSVWDILEPSIAVIVSALPIYRALLSTSKKQRAASYTNIPNTRCHQPEHELTSIVVPKNGADRRHAPDLSHTTVRADHGAGLLR